MMKNKKGFLLRDFVVVGIIFGIVIAMFVFGVASIANNYNNDQIVNPTFAKHYAKLTDNLNQLNTANKAVQGSGGLNLIGTFNVAFNSVFTVVAMVWDGVLIYTGMATNVVSDFTFLDANVITIFLESIIAIVVTYLIFIWISSVSRGKL